MSNQLVLKLAPEWEEVTRVRKSTAQFLKSQNVSRDVVDAVAMVACELTENATKYGHFADRQRPTIDVKVALSDKEITVEVSNPVSHEQGDLSRLDRMVQWIRGFQDPFEAYLQRLRELSGDGLDTHESRLGLVRIAYEGQSILDFYVNEHDVLAVSAMRRL